MALKLVKSLSPQFDIEVLLLEIRMLYKKGEFSKSLEKAEGIDLLGDITTIQHIELLLILGKVHIAIGDPKETDDLIEDLLSDIDMLSVDKALFEGKYHELRGLYYEKQSEWNNALDHYYKARDVFRQLKTMQEYAAVLFNIGSTLQKQGSKDEGLKLLQESLGLRENIGNKYDILESLNIIGIVLAKKGKLDKSNDIFKRCLDICEEIDEHHTKAKIFINLGNMSRMKGEFREASSEFKKAVDISKKIGDTQTLTIATISLGSIHLELGDLDESINNYMPALTFLERSGNKYQLASVHNNLGLVYEKKGELNNALNYYEISLGIREELEDKDSIGKSLKNVGKIKFLQGHLDQANNDLVRSLKIFQEIDNTLLHSEVSMNLGMLHNKQGDLKGAESYLLKSLDYRNAIGNKALISESIFALLTIYLENGEKNKAEKQLQILKKIVKKSKNKVVITRLKLAEAAVLQSSGKITKIADAQELYEQVIDEDLVDFELTVFAMLNLCEFLLLELRSTNDEDTLMELTNLVEKLHEVAIEQESYNLICEILIIQSKLALLQTNVKDARFLIDQAITIADGRNMDRITLKATMIRGQLESKIEKWSEVAFQNIPISEKIDELELEEFIQNIYLKKESTDMFVHDIKNLLQINLNVANLLSINNSLPENMKEYVYLLESSSREIQMLISSYMTSDKLENGTFNIHYELVDLKKFISERISLFRLKIDTNNLQVIHKMPDDNYLIRSDRFLLGRIFDNLIHNAVKFTPNNGDIVVEIEQSQTEQNIKIINDGPVIPKEYHHKIFEKYEQYKIEGRKVGSGFGLGLAFCKKAIEKLDGSIVVESPITGQSEGVGFIITLPR